MAPVSIPQWTSQGVLPPNNSTEPTSFDRSPYEVPMTDLVLRYGTSVERKSILKGFLGFRSALSKAGLVNGFQWIDGSFLENIESTEGRSPRDMDVVTFFHLPDGFAPESMLRDTPRLFNPMCTKEDFHVDAYFVRLNGGVPEELVWQSAYWYSLWSHRRNGQWKGYLRVVLSSVDDEVAQANLDNVTYQGDRP